MKKKTWGIIMIVLAILGLVGGFASGSILALGFVSLIGFLAAVGALLFFGIKFIKSGK